MVRRPKGKSGEKRLLEGTEISIADTGQVE